MPRSSSSSILTGSANWIRTDTRGRPGRSHRSPSTSIWRAGLRGRAIVRRERAHPGAQLSFSDRAGHRFRAILTDKAGQVAELERDHRGPARVEDHVRNDKETGLRNLPFRDFEHNHVWLAIVSPRA